MSEKNVAVLYQNGAYGQPCLQAFARSLETAGNVVIDCSDGQRQPPKDHLFSVVFGTIHPSRRGKNVHVCVEAGYFLRQHVPTDHVFYTVNYRKILDLPVKITTEGEWRFERMVQRYTPLLPSFEKRPVVNNTTLVLGQIPRDHSHPFKTTQEMFKWFYKQIECKSQVIYRTHPHEPAPPLPPSWKIDQCRTIEESLGIHQPARVVTYSSTAGLWALCDGFDVKCGETAWYRGMEPEEAGTIAAQSSFQMSELEDGTALAYFNRHCQEKHGINLRNTITLPNAPPFN